MIYDFDRLIDRRNTASVKWDSNQALFGRESLLDMWVADMDFPCPEQVVRAIRERAEHPVFGYTYPEESLYEAIMERLERHFDWKVKKEWIVFTAGVVNGLHLALKAYTRPGDEVVIQPPVYYPFFNSIKDSGCLALHNPLAFDGSRYTMSLTGLENLFLASETFPVRSPRIKMFILCSPHNPVGRVWTREELLTLGEICLKNGCLLISDEIHCDLMVGESRHTVTASLSEQLERQTITLMSASKTFNLAGLDTSFAVIPDDRLRKEFVQAQAGHSTGNIFGLTALEAAYRHGDQYLAQLKEYLTGNIEYFIAEVEKRMPALKVIRPEGTYLAWVDMRGLGMSPLKLQSFIRDRAGLALDDGFIFGPGGEGFQRFNLACPRSVVAEALARLEEAVKTRP
ncbi:MAG: cystathionine beta-lyase [Peptococcaceae bacterium BICA1-7]|nr:MAG: cystathionine beta-lyase [Peptococcaceae bacterium BICA1-7]HBV99366.1 pyridoxal phosphate-dependent aminotransferase [Desulfotomaculum sp.]